MTHTLFRTSHVWMTKLLLLLGLGVCVAPVYAGTKHFYYTDAQGTVLAKTDAQGNIIARYDYKPYGAPMPGSQAYGPTGYTGHVNDAETGLVYMQARYYDPLVGRFLSVDPVGPKPGNGFNFNRYGYGNNNPIRFTDPDGRCSDADGSCGRLVQSPGAPEAAKLAVNFIPVVSDVSNIVDAFQNPSLSSIAVAVIGVIPEGGSIAGKVLKFAKEVKVASKGVAVAKGAARAERGAINVTSAGRTVDKALTTGQRFVGEGAQEVAPGVFRSADGTKQFRMTDADITGGHGKIGSHVHFEKFDPVTGDKIKNIHTPLIDP